MSKQNLFESLQTHLCRCISHFELAISYYIHDFNSYDYNYNNADSTRIGLSACFIRCYVHCAFILMVIFLIIPKTNTLIYCWLVNKPQDTCNISVKIEWLVVVCIFPPTVLINYNNLHAMCIVKSTAKIYGTAIVPSRLHMWLQIAGHLLF